MQSSHEEGKEESPQQVQYDTYESRDKVFKGICERARKHTRKGKPTALEITQLLDAGDFIQAISELRRLNDARCGIDSSYEKLDNSPVNFLSRNAGKRTPPAAEDKLAGSENWAIMGLNYLCAAKKVVELNRGLLSSKEQVYLNRQAAEFFDVIQNSQDPEIEFAKFVHEVVVRFVETRLPKEKNVKKLLADARDFNNFDYDTISIATEIRVPLQQAFAGEEGKEVKKSKRFLLVDVPMTGAFTTVQISELERLASDVEDEELSDIEWYQALNSHARELVRTHAKDVLDGKIIPTQLRKFFPGLRNAGHERIYDFDTGEMVFEGYHSGTLGHDLPERNAEATMESVKQAHQITGATHLVVLSLLSPGRGGVDYDLVTQIDEATEAHNADRRGRKLTANIHFANVPINGFRRIDAPRRDGVDFVYIEAKKLLNRYSLALSQPSLTTPLLQHVESKIPPSKKVALDRLRAAVADFEKVRSGSGLRDGENANLSLASAVDNMAHCINAVMGRRYIAVLKACQSGKDRVALEEVKVAEDAMLGHITKGKTIEASLETYKTQQQDIRHAYAQSGHLQTRAGMTGGTIGAKGIKQDSESGIPSSWGDQTPLIETTASYNKELPSHPKKKVKGWRIAGAILGGIVGVALCLTLVGAPIGSRIAAMGYNELREQYSWFKRNKKSETRYDDDLPSAPVPSAQQRGGRTISRFGLAEPESEAGSVSVKQNVFPRSTVAAVVKELDAEEGLKASVKTSRAAKASKGRQLQDPVGEKTVSAAVVVDISQAEPAAGSPSQAYRSIRRA